MNNGTMMYPEDSIFCVEDKKGGLQREKNLAATLAYQQLGLTGFPVVINKINTTLLART